ncbi:hypothetical protein [Paractinoplanes atraurantiacus]|uniref:PIN domain-containing protein n=1 Tax=Paractinoplanes atraurantiacus TaxID=1036182 RepID=A0A285J4B7_9ACTN|nr:hypothetical protein [Actinoplanes atraurantiacus]SNY55165.1 hypothetical protein SAMN05421748_11660 [Actinoplanes atraurantiacus]
MNATRAPRILDASAVVEMFAGHPKLMKLLEKAQVGEEALTMPALAVAEAQAALRYSDKMWQYFFGISGLTEQTLSWFGALEAGSIASARLEHYPMQPALIGPIMVGQVVHEAREMDAVVVTRIPEAYGAYDVALHLL